MSFGFEKEDMEMSTSNDAGFHTTVNTDATFVSGAEITVVGEVVQQPTPHLETEPSMAAPSPTKTDNWCMAFMIAVFGTFAVALAVYVLYPVIISLFGASTSDWGQGI